MVNKDNKKIIYTNTMVIGLVMTIVCGIGMLLTGKFSILLWAITLCSAIVATASYIEWKKL